MKLSPEVKVAIAYLRGPAEFNRDELMRNERIVIAAELCPNCASESDGAHYVKLNPFEHGDYWSYAGRSCPDCEEFYPDYANSPCYDTSPECFSDADPGL